MTDHTQIAAHMTGEAISHETIEDIGTGTATPDALSIAFTMLADACDGEYLGDAERGFFRVIQKHLEARA